MKFLFIFPFSYNEERYKLFNFCIKKLNNQLQKFNIDSNLLLHEIGKTSLLCSEFKELFDYYHFSCYNEDIFNKAWNINKIVKNFEFKENTYLILMDCDLLVKDDWIKNLKYQKDFTIGWSGVWYLNEKYTKKVLNNNVDINKFKISDWKEIGSYHVPDINGSAGGITFISSDLFLKVKGIPEYFKGTWGNTDTSFAYKMKHLGYNFNIYPYQIIHLNHTHKTIRNKNIQNKWLDIKTWSSEKWMYEIDNLQNWGD